MLREIQVSKELKVLLEKLDSKELREPKEIKDLMVIRVLKV